MFSFCPLIRLYIPTGTLLAQYSDSLLSKNCKFSRIALKDIFATLKLRLEYDLSISVNDRVILSFHEGFIFAKLRVQGNKSPTEIYSTLQFIQYHEVTSQQIAKMKLIHQNVWPQGCVLLLLRKTSKIFSEMTYQN